MSPKPKIAVVLKGYPRLSETFIAQELLGLERAGHELVLIALRRPTDGKRHPVHDEIRAPVHYLPEYLHEEPWRVLRALARAVAKRSFWRMLRPFFRDLARDRSRNRFRRLGQALVLAAEWPDDASWLHAHFIHTPASVTSYASMISGIPWTCSAHAKDIWTSQDWELSDKLGRARWTVTCTRSGYEHLRDLSSDKTRVHLSYHGLDLDRFPSFDGEHSRRDGSVPDDPVRIVSVGRAVSKKGYDILLKALSLLPADLSWRFDHIGAGEFTGKLQVLAGELGLEDRIGWHGALDQKEVLSRYREADIFALASRVAANGDRDGLPNVLVEASSQRLACISTAVSGIPELIDDGHNGMLVPPESPTALAAAMERLIRDPDLRRRLGDAAERRVRADFDHHSSVGQLIGLFESEWRRSP
ncbi:colanic acid biosynthesis glycosyltransferase WcaL [Sinorhizobium medicae]|uniref:glycosyltransferase family 4 protein n=1 Tax=Sinorhizobium medicae TaxID=110321 RepID=UPI000C7CEEC6|nr:glycosyltransferase family 4 protein [Sinorhizobium medicae]PLU11696.1 colanic acid biosynthesis glycosyltransferase WcaL [Sinorhizobium medicae]PLU40978.1 colanic acid biosynthesis glycosyltransferase WcaL [Sinorhizobium medicae]PLU60057.1 colanic acid biosynthesis glycosyltransferase WcaL [Sinorhizobium medicae]PLU68962.1 colanic acid biosynthesis glycosyltransferase WcaL [Sinorhizobium medicae]